MSDCSEEEQNKAQKNEYKIKRLGAEILLVEDDSTEDERNQNAAASYH